jgi:putative redox protein
MNEVTKVQHLNNMSFTAEVDGHEFKIDADADFGGTDQGPRPKKLLLAALAGCTAMDVVSILKKMRMSFDSFWIEVSGVLSETEPKVFTAFALNYCFRGKELDREKIKKAITLSQKNYCSVSAMFRSFAQITYTISLNP